MNELYIKSIIDLTKPKAPNLNGVEEGVEDAKGMYCVPLPFIIKLLFKHVSMIQRMTNGGPAGHFWPLGLFVLPIE
jgi:hypothetical protein